MASENLISKFGYQASIKGRVSRMQIFGALKLVGLCVFLNAINAFPIHHEVCSSKGSDGKNCYLGMPLVDITLRWPVGELGLHRRQDNPYLF
jgi:hypothetical protein